MLYQNCRLLVFYANDEFESLNSVMTPPSVNSENLAINGKFKIIITGNTQKTQ